MSTDISVSSTAYQVENRSWLLGLHGTDPGATPGVTLDVSAFDADAHYPDGYIPSGTVVAKLTSGGKVVPYLAGGTGGAETAYGILFSSVKVPENGADVGGAVVRHGFVNPAKLPFTSSTTEGGFLDTAGRADLPLIDFA